MRCEACGRFSAGWGTCDLTPRGSTLDNLSQHLTAPSTGNITEQQKRKGEEFVDKFSARLMSLPRGQQMKECQETRRRIIGKEHIIGLTPDSFREMMDEFEQGIRLGAFG